MIHRERYQRLAPEGIKAVIVEQEQQNAVLNPKWREEGFAHYLDWFFTKWARRPSPEKEAEFYQILQRACFVNPAVMV